ncbi:hypothetical protein DM01DRAFT_1339532 [Hesseltinella vesiculosa]|uniref:Uncharacterized protein n=1 Tax=Hesseltinella vesiculosa TaxID=101127 RepID=A0A1X2G6R7_9FUNG|nr:hypothetical protein DM01DRAFT_1339532 [Hesseltinella vesiculosa]
MTYQLLNGTGDVKKLRVRYNMAKWLTTVSLIAVVTMAVYALLYPSIRMDQWKNRVTDEELEDAQEQPSPPPAHGSITTHIRNSTCRFTADNMIFPLENSNYTQFQPDDTLRQVLDYVSDADFNKYCDQWDPVYGMSGHLEMSNENENCGAWQQEFAQLQQQRLQQLDRFRAGTLKSPKDVPRFASYLCQEDPQHRGSHGCGGLADRMIGIVSTFFYALMTDRGFLMSWPEGDPARLESVFEKPTIDWSFDPSEMRSLYKKPGYQTVNTLNFNWQRIRGVMFPQGPSQDFNQLWPEPYVQVQSNRGYVIRTFDYSDHYAPKLEQMGLSKSNHWRCIVDYLFKPKLESRRFINAYKKLFQMDSVLSIGLQIRTNDTAMADPDKDTNTLEDWDYYFTCANKLRDARREPHHRRVVYFLLTDSSKLREQFVSMNHDKELRDKFIQDDDTSMVVTGLPIEHIEAKTVKTKAEIGLTEDDSNLEKLLAGTHSAIIDNWLLSYTDYRLISRQGFGKIAAFHASNSHSTISLPRLESKEHLVNCASPHAFTSFETLSTWWSLG